MASWVRKTNVRLKENWSKKRHIEILKHSLTNPEIICVVTQDVYDLALDWMWCELPYRKRSTAPVLVMRLLLSWGGECFLGGLRCNHRKWWRTWPPPPQLGWQPGRSGSCPAPHLAGRQEKLTFNRLAYSVPTLNASICQTIIYSKLINSLPLSYFVFQSSNPTHRLPSFFKKKMNALLWITQI